MLVIRDLTRIDVKPIHKPIKAEIFKWHCITYGAEPSTKTIVINDKQILNRHNNGSLQGSIPSHPGVMQSISKDTFFSSIGSPS